MHCETRNLAAAFLTAMIQTPIIRLGQVPDTRQKQPQDLRLSTFDNSVAQHWPTDYRKAVVLIGLPRAFAKSDEALNMRTIM